MTCSVCGGPVGTETLAGREWYKCTKCGAWVAPRSDPVSAAGMPAPQDLQETVSLRGRVQIPVPQSTNVMGGTTYGHRFESFQQVGVSPSMGGVKGGPHGGIKRGLPPLEAMQESGGFPPDLASVPLPPRKPSPLAKKLIFSYQGTQRIILIIGIMFTLVGGASTFFLFRTIPAEIALAFSSKQGVGRIVDVDEDTGIVINYRHVVNFTVQYDVDGTTYEFTTGTANPKLIQVLMEHGKAIPIEYSTLFPRFAKIQGVPLSPMGWSRYLFMITPCIGILMFVSAWRSNRREIWAYRKGVPAIGRIVERTFDRSVRSGNQSPRLIRWAFEVGGVTYTGTLSNMDWVTLDEALPGPWVIVLYDPKNPKRNTVYIN